MNMAYILGIAIFGGFLVGGIIVYALCRINKGEDEALNRPSEAKQARKRR